MLNRPSAHQAHCGEEIAVATRLAVRRLEQDGRQVVERKEKDDAAAGDDDAASPPGGADLALAQLRTAPDALFRCVPMLHTDGLIVPKIFALMLLINLCDEKEWISKHVALDEKVLRCALAGLKSASVANAASTAAHVARGSSVPMISGSAHSTFSSKP